MSKATYLEARYVDRDKLFALLQRLFSTAYSVNVISSPVVHCLLSPSDAVNAGQRGYDGNHGTESAY
jgi:hypothetical protein